MSFPSSKELKKIRKELKNVEPTIIIGPSASAADQLKFTICKEMITYLRVRNLSQHELAEELGVDPARVSEIVKYKIDLYTVDRLLDLLEQLNPKVKVTVA